MCIVCIRMWVWFIFLSSFECRINRAKCIVVVYFYIYLNDLFMAVENKRVDTMENIHKITWLITGLCVQKFPNQRQRQQQLPILMTKPNNSLQRCTAQQEDNMFTYIFSYGISTHVNIVFRSPCHPYNAHNPCIHFGPLWNVCMLFWIVISLFCLFFLFFYGQNNKIQYEIKVLHCPINLIGLKCFYLPFRINGIAIDKF